MNNFKNIKPHLEAITKILSEVNREELESLRQAGFSIRSWNQLINYIRQLGKGIGHPVPKNTISNVAYDLDRALQGENAPPYFQAPNLKKWHKN